MPLPTLITPTADFGLTYTAVLGTALQVEGVLTSYSDVQLVTGSARLLADLVRFFYTPIGSNPFAPTYGNQLLDQLGQPQAAAEAFYGALLQQAEADFLAFQATAASAGFLALDEQLDHFDAETIVITGSILTITLAIVAKSGDRTQTTLSLAPA